MYQGFFINLSRNQERLRSLTQHLAEIGATSIYRRFEAVDGLSAARENATPLSPGELGCRLSHEAILAATEGPDVHVHIIEDDTMFARSALASFAPALQFCDTQLKKWDLLFTDIIIPYGQAAYRAFASKMEANEATGNLSLVNLADMDFASASSYFVNHRSIGKIADALAAPWAKGVPIDICFRHLARQRLATVFATVPFLTSISPGGQMSDIRGKVDRSRRVMEIYRRSFFKDADCPSLLAEMDALVHGAEPQPGSRFYLGMLRVVLDHR